jgi:hypothetical protein
MTLQDKRLQVLKDVEQGKITVEAGSRLLGELETVIVPAEIDGVASENIIESSGAMPERLGRVSRWRFWWLIPFGVGVVMTILGGIWMVQGWEAARLGVGFWLAWIPFGLGILLIALSWYSRRWVWLHVRIRQKMGVKPARIAISLPLPWVLIYWGLRIADRYMPQEVRGKGVAQMVNEVGKYISPDMPFHVEVEGDDGEQVEVYIG